MFLCLQIDFDKSYPVNLVRMMQRTYQHEQFKDFTLTFEDGTTQNVSYPFEVL